jgi:hypothetical protein
VTLETGSGEFAHGGHPVLGYSVKTDRGTFLPAAGGLGFFENQVQQLAPWLADLVNPVLGDLDFGASWGILEWGMIGVILLVALLVIRSFGETLKMRKNRGSVRQGVRDRVGRRGRFGLRIGSVEFGNVGGVLLRLVVIAIGVILAIPSDPVTDTAGYLTLGLMLVEIAFNN